MTTSLLELLNVLGRIVELEAARPTCSTAPLPGLRSRVEDLKQAGVFPPPRSSRKPPKAAVPKPSATGQETLL